jgi:hypothetical protein
MKNKEKKPKFTWKQIWPFRSSDWDWLFAHSCLIFIFGKEAIKHKSWVATILIVLCAIVLVLRDLAIVQKWWLYTNPPNPKYIKSHMLYMAIELMFTFLMGLFGKLWNAPFLLLIFMIWTITIIPVEVKTLNATSYIVKRWARFWPRTL